MLAVKFKIQVKDTRPLILQLYNHQNLQNKSTHVVITIIERMISTCIVIFHNLMSTSTYDSLLEITNDSWAMNDHKW